MKKNATIAVMVLALALLLAPGFIGHAAAQAPPPVVCGDTISVTDSIAGTEGTQVDRIFRDAIPSTCANKAYPGLFTVGDVYYETFYYTNATGFDACYIVNFDTGSCGAEVHASAYLNSYDPNNQGVNYLGDLGSSSPGSFSFTVPAGQTFVIVVNTNTGLNTCADYSFNLIPDCSTVPATNDYGMVVFAVLAALGSILVISRKSTA